MMDHDRFAQFGTRFGTQKSPGVATETGEVMVGAEVLRACGWGSGAEVGDGEADQSVAE